MDLNDRSTEAVFEKAYELAHALLKTDIYKRMKRAESDALQDGEAQQLMGEYNANKTALEELMTSDNPDGDQMKTYSQSMGDIQKKLALINSVRELSQARADFTELINQINQVLSFVITGEIKGDISVGECGGSCAECGGSCGIVG